MTNVLKDGSMRSKFVTITPQKAQELLDSQPKNRIINTRRVTAYAALMRKGDWNEYHPQGLIFDEEGLLMDGQHRLLAVAQSGCSIQFYCTTNARRETKLLLDTAAPRSADQTGQIMGLETSKLKIATAKFLLADLTSSRLPRSVPHAEILATYEQYRVGIDLACGSGHRSGIPACARAAVAVGMHHTNRQDELESFLNILVTGYSEEPRDCCAIALRNLCLRKTRASTTVEAKMEVYRRGLTAVWSYLDGQCIKTPREARVNPFVVNPLN